MSGWLHFSALLIYGVATAVLGVSFARSDERLPRLAVWTLAAGLAVHAGALAAYVVEWGELPLVGLGPSLSSLAFLVGLGMLIVATLGHAGTVGLVLVPVVALLTGVAVAVRVVPAGEPMAFEGAWFALHVVFAFVGYAGLTIAFAAGLMYLLQFKQLKSKHFGAIFRFFPPLDTLDRLGWTGLLIGFPFLTLSLLLGWGWMAQFAGVESAGGLKLIWAVLSWLIFVAAILARLGAGRSARRGALASVIGFVAVVLIYLLIRAQGSNGGGFL
jgi:ABC-type uncharacterized transport system permease subunit